MRPPNPFGSAMTRPGALRYCWPGDPPQSTVVVRAQRRERDAKGSERADPQNQADTQNQTARLAAKIARTERALIIGPHGAGKSTLLAELARELKRVGAASEPKHQVAMVMLHSHQSSKIDRRTLDKLQAGDRLIVDGLEQLDRMVRQRLLGLCRKRSISMLGTSHRSLMGFRVVAEIQPDRENARKLTSILLDAHRDLHDQLLSEFDSLWVRCEGNLRDVWSHLYDSFESQLNSN